VTVARRDFLRLAGSCAAHLAIATAGVGVATRELFARTGARAVIQEEPWGRLEAVADGVWALVSTPLEDRTTLCNGGIVVGTHGVVVVEAFASAEGAAWMAGRARALSGRWPDQVVLTHYHADHTGGCAGFADQGGTAVLHATEVTRDATDATAAARDQAPDSPLRRAMAAVRVIPDHVPTELDLGGRVLRIEPLAGHTASDAMIRVLDPPVLFCGDLLWNGMFPNYVDARPATLSESVARLARSDAGTVFVPGHGPVAGADDLERYLGLLEHVEGAAREAHAAGRSAEEAAATFVLPASLGEWFRFSPDYPRRALDAWLRELAGA
jgi:glyoxylase-like metal-dependent hydrolase (beta-lactamase superfamily II)